MEVQWTVNLEAQGEVQFSGIMDDFLDSARLGRDRLDVASEEVMVPSPNPTDVTATLHRASAAFDKIQLPRRLGPESFRAE